MCIHDALTSICDSERCKWNFEYNMESTEEDLDELMYYV